MANLGTGTTERKRGLSQFLITSRALRQRARRRSIPQRKKRREILPRMIVVLAAMPRASLPLNRYVVPSLTNSARRIDPPQSRR
jgi:hypothetical protein